MSSWNTLFGGLISSATEVLVAKENAKANARQYEADALRASIVQAETARQRELALAAQFQQYLNDNNQIFVKVLNILLITVAVSLIGIIFFNLLKRRRG